MRQNTDYSQRQRQQKRKQQLQTGLEFKLQSARNARGWNCVLGKVMISEGDLCMLNAGAGGGSQSCESSFREMKAASGRVKL